jgi:hypothetical protein
MLSDWPGETVDIVPTHVVLVPSFARNQQLDSATRGGILESNSVVITLVREDGLPLLSSLERNLQLLHDFNRDRGWCGEVPDLFAFLLRFSEKLGDVRRVGTILGFAEMKLVGDDLRNTRPSKTLLAIDLDACGR